MSRQTAASVADPAWRRAHPLPAIGDGLDKEARGRVLLVGGSGFVPGAPRLTGEAALRAGAGKVQIATIEAHAALLGLLMPEVAVIALPADDQGEIAATAADILGPKAEDCDVLIVGVGMRDRPQTSELVLATIAASARDCVVLLDAGAMTAMGDEAKRLHGCGRRLVMTPHPGELASLTGKSEAAIRRDPARVAREAARRFAATVVLKSAETLIASASGDILHYAADAPGLGTAGSGDVLAGVIGGLLARGADLVTAAGWGVWLHGQAGTTAALQVGPLGFLARELSREVPALMAGQVQR